MAGLVNAPLGSARLSDEEPGRKLGPDVLAFNRDELTVNPHHFRYLLRQHLEHHVPANVRLHVVTSIVTWLALVTLLSQAPLPLAIPLLGGNLGSAFALLSFAYWLPADFVVTVAVAGLTLAWARCPGAPWGPGHGYLAGVVDPLVFVGGSRWVEHLSHVYHHEHASFLHGSERPADARERLHALVWRPFHFVLLGLLGLGWRPKLKASLGEAEDRVLATLRRVPWMNWAALVACNAERVWAPGNVDDLARAVAQARALGLHVRLVASGFSWSGLSASNEALIFCERLVGVTVDTDSPGAPFVWADAGVTNRQLNAELARFGLCMPWNVVLETVRVAGIVSTGTHGTGRTTATVGDLVLAFEIIDAEGRMRTLSDETVGPEVMNAARIGLGLFGVIARVKLRVVPLQRVRLVDRRAPVPDLLAKLPELVARHDALELYWFPFNRDAWVRTVDRADAPHAQRAHGFWFKTLNLFQNLWAVAGLRLIMRFAPGLTPALMRVAFRLLPFGTRVVDLPASHHYHHWVEVMPAGCMEVGFKVDPDLANVLHAWRTTERLVLDYARRGLYPLNLSLNMRFIGSSRALLTPAYGEGLTCYIEIMWMGRPEGWEAFSSELCTEWLKAPGALPHFAKEFEHVPNVTAIVRANLGDRRERFLRALAASEMDPERAFFNPMVRRLLLDADAPS